MGSVHQESEIQNYSFYILSVGGIINKRSRQLSCHQHTAGTKFGTASAGKAFVAVAIMKLIEEGELTLKSKIGILLDFDLKQIDPAITVEQLLSHTSGIPDYFDESAADNYAALFYNYPNYKIRSSRSLLPLFIDKSMIYPKGERFQYNNTGYAVLGMIIESVTGKPFDEYLHQVVFAPLGMDGTGYYELDRLPANCANAYIHDHVRGGYYTNIYSIDVKGTGAGGAFSCVGDIRCFWQGLMVGAVIRKETFADMIKPTALTPEYGYGFWLRLNGKKIIPWFTGSDPGVSFISECDLDRERITTIFNNMEQNVWKLSDEIRRSLDG